MKHSAVQWTLTFRLSHIKASFEVLIHVFSYILTQRCSYFQLYGPAEITHSSVAP